MYPKTFGAPWLQGVVVPDRCADGMVRIKLDDWTSGYGGLTGVVLGIDEADKVFTPLETPVTIVPVVKPKDTTLRNPYDTSEA